ncbi:MAG: Calx-beta domain-containing protein, partial [bacterium]
MSPANNTITNTISVKDKPGTFQFESAQLDINETAGIYQIKVLRTSGSGGAATVAYSVVPGTATTGVDYTSPTTGILQFADGQTSATFTITINDDANYEGNEIINLGLLNPSGGTSIGSPSSCILTLVDNETLPVISVADATTPEGNTAGLTLIFTVQLSLPSDLTTTVKFSTLADTALAGSDFVTKSGTITFAPGEMSKQVAIEILSDQLYERDEKFYFVLDTPFQATIGTSRAIGTILNDDPMPGLRVTDTTINEPTGSSSILNINVVLTQPSTLPVTVDYATANDSATSPADYNATTGSIVFQPGETTKSIKIVIKGDSIYELTEKFQFVLSSAVGASLDQATATCTIVDDDPKPTISINQVTITEPDTGSTATANVIVSLSAASSQPVKVFVEPVDDSAMNGLDYRALAAEILIPAGSVSATYPVTIIGDRIHEADETMTVKLTSVTGEPVSQSTGSVKIIDNDPQILATISDSILIEGDSGTTNIVFPVTLSAVPEIPVSIEFYTLDGTATGSIDYQITRGTLTIPAGQTTASIQVPVIGDTNVERSSMIFSLVLTNPLGLALARNMATGTIRDNDSPGTFFFDKPEFQVNENIAGG